MTVHEFAIGLRTAAAKRRRCVESGGCGANATVLLASGPLSSNSRQSFVTGR